MSSSPKYVVFIALYVVVYCIAWGTSKQYRDNAMLNKIEGAMQYVHMRRTSFHMEKALNSVEFVFQGHVDQTADRLENLMDSCVPHSRYVWTRIGL